MSDSSDVVETEYKTAILILITLLCFVLFGYFAIWLFFKIFYMFF